MSEPTLAAIETAAAIPLVEDAAKTAGPALLRHFPGIRHLLSARWQADFPEIERALAAFEHDLRIALEHCCCHGGPVDTRPATVTVTATTKEH